MNESIFTQRQSIFFGFLGCEFWDLFTFLGETTSLVREDPPVPPTWIPVMQITEGPRIYLTFNRVNEPGLFVVDFERHGCRLTLAYACLMG